MSRKLPEAVTPSPENNEPEAVTPALAECDQWRYFEDGSSRLIPKGDPVPEGSADSPAAFEKVD